MKKRVKEKWGLYYNSDMEPRHSVESKGAAIRLRDAIKSLPRYRQIKIDVRKVQS